MLHENVLMRDIDVDHWRNLQSLVLDSAKGKRRIIVLHEQGAIEKLVHSDGLPVEGVVDRVDDPHALAEQLYQANQQNVDFVAVFDRRAFDEYFGRFQATWSPDEDLDEFVHRTYALLDEFPEGIVTAPRPARMTLGLQWRISASYADVRSTIERFVTPSTSIVVGVFEGTQLWSSLVLSFDEDRRIDVLTTVDPSLLSPGASRKTTSHEVIAQVEQRYRRCEIALFMDVAGARDLLAHPAKGAILGALFAKGCLEGSRIPSEIRQLATT